MTKCYHCSAYNDSLVIECIICKQYIHHHCLFNANCVPEKWHNCNTPSKAVLHIFNSVNFSFRCTSCIDKIYIDDQSHLSIPDIPTSKSKTLHLPFNPLCDQSLIALMKLKL